MSLDNPYWIVKKAPSVTNFSFVMGLKTRFQTSIQYGAHAVSG
ncbi:Uncharacterised protein [Vibrio cholerae]|nr:Uncharacterised protein [Vibrio cholerae]